MVVVKPFKIITITRRHRDYQDSNPGPKIRYSEFFCVFSQTFQILE
jgi:hypothetical protein